MIIINTISDNRFTYNGVTYFRNFTPFVTGNKVSIVNAYNSCVSLTDAPTIFSDFVVDGVTYANVNDLQVALLPVVYTRSSLLGFTPENVANKATNLTSPDNTKYPTTLAVSTALSGKQDILTNPITGTGTTNYVSKFTGASTLGNSLIFDNGTNVYIGTTSPAAPARFGVVSTNFTAIRAEASSGFNAIQIGGNGRFSMDAVGNAGGRFFIGDTGFVGIGNGSPGARLDVRAQGALSTNIAFRVRNSADNNDLIRIQGDGNVGFGTTAPTSRLHVVGLPSYADNAAAISGGLTVGAFYHTAGILKVVI